MKKLILFALVNFAFLLTLSNSASAQIVEPAASDRDKPVVTTQGFIDDATKAFDLVREYRDALAKAESADKLSIVERQSAQALLKGFNELLAIKDKTIATIEQLSAIYEKVLALQNTIIERLQKIIEVEENRKSRGGFLRDLWKGAKQVFTILLTVITVKKVADIVR